jgi:hypothetical protein
MGGFQGLPVASPAPFKIDAGILTTAPALRKYVIQNRDLLEL